MRSRNGTNLRWQLLVLPAALFLFLGCDRWSSTTLLNDSSTPVRLHLYYPWNGGELTKKRLPGEVGESAYVWTTTTPEGEMPRCDTSVFPMDSGEVVEEVPVELLERWQRSEACVDVLPVADAHALHMTLAPGGSLHLARALGQVAGHYLDSLVMEAGPNCYRLRSSEAIAKMIDQGAGGEFTVRTSRIKEEAGPCRAR
ncbi:MAG: hypothetical protein R2815_13240 [Flavobacteriales bacterium]